MAGVEDMIKQAVRSVDRNTHGVPNEITRWYNKRNGWGLKDLWCDMSITFWAFRSGNYEAVCFGIDFASTTAHVEAFRHAHQFHDGAGELTRGDIVFFPREGHAIGHVGLVRKVEGDIVKTIEGNTSDACRHRTHRISAGQIVGYGRPKYSKKEELTIADAATRKYFEQKFAEIDKQVVDLYRLTDHGTTKKATTRTHHQALRKDLDGLHTQMVQVTGDLTDLQTMLTGITTQLTQLIQDSHPQPKPRKGVTT